MGRIPLSDLLAASLWSLTPLSKTLLHQKRVAAAYVVCSVPKSLPKPSLPHLRSLLLGFTLLNEHKFTTLETSKPPVLPKAAETFESSALVCGNTNSQQLSNTKETRVSV